MDIKKIKKLFYSDKLTQTEKREFIKYYENKIKELQKIEKEHRKENGILRKKLKKINKEE